jgi:hypothetical protein
MSGRKNLIMGLLSHMRFDQVEKFLGSLRRTRFDGDVCMFVVGAGPDTIDALLAHGVLVERVDHTPLPAMNDQASRYFAYLDFLARNSERYANVMISDLRDVVFQSDPFERPLPADVVFALERRRIGDELTNRNWIAAAYDDAVADNLRDFQVSCSGTTFGTAAGMLRYLAAMTTELAALTGRDVLQIRGIDQGIHNYVVRMRPLRQAWFDSTDSIVATLQFVPDTSIETTPRGILVDGRLTPVLHQWDRNEIASDYVWASPQFRPAAMQPPARRAAQAHAVLAFYHRPRDADWLAPFLASLRCGGYADSLHCVGAFDPGELALLERFGAVPHPVDPVDPALDVENTAHLFLSRVLDRLAANEASRPDQVLALDTVRAGFLRDPFRAETIGLSVFLESSMRIGESEYNLQRLAFFSAPDEVVLRRPIVSSALLRGRLDIVRAFYRKLFVEFVGRAELLRVHKAIQGAFNKLCHGDGLEVPIIQHPNGAEAYFEIWGEGLPASAEPPIRVAGAVPFVVMNPVRETELMRGLRATLGL